MQTNKKILSIAVTALLLLSILAAAVPAFAITNGTVNIYVPNATPTVLITHGAVGTKVEVIGTATADTANPFAVVTVYWDTISPSTVLGTATSAADGSYAINMTIPTAVNGVHNLIVSDGVAPNVGKAFTVDASLSAGIPPVRAMPGDSVTLSGKGFAASTTTAITFNGGTFAPMTVTTDANGTFTATIVIPADTTLSAVAYTVTAAQAGPITATALVTVNYYLTVRPSGAVSPVPPGSTVTISGRISPNTPYSLAIDAVTVASGTSDANGRFSNTYTLPLLTGAGAHSITITATGITIPAVTLTTGFSPQIQILDLVGAVTTQAVPGTTLRVATVTPANPPGVYSATANITLTFGTTVVNSTATDARFGPTTAAGLVDAQFAVPALAPGTYTVTLTDEFGASASTSFTINAAPVTTISTAATYAQGDTISFSIVTTETGFTAGPIVTIRDPTGAIWYSNTVAWPLTGAATKRVLFQDQLFAGTHAILPANAPTGSWNYTVVYTPASTGVSTTFSALFTVVAGGTTGITSQLTDMNTTLAGINAKLDNMNLTLVSIKNSVATLQSANGTQILASISALDAKVTGITGTIATLQTSMGTVSASVSSLSGSISSISNGVATIQTSLGTVTTSLSSIDAVLGAVAGDTTTLKTSLGTVTTSLDSLNTKVTALSGLSGDIATVKTDLGTLQGTVTSISGNVATIQTSIGTMQADISGLKTDVANVQSGTNNLSPLVIVAIVLALIAAIAAIASIVLMRRKIAG